MRALEILASYERGCVNINAGKDAAPCWIELDAMGDFLRMMAVQELERRQTAATSAAPAVCDSNSRTHLVNR